MVFNFKAMKLARLALGISREEMAAEAGMTPKKLMNQETGGPHATYHAATALKRALEERGVIFVVEDEEVGPGFRLPGDHSARQKDEESQKAPSD